MKILLVNKFHYLKGGSEKYYFELANLLKEKGHQIAFFSMKDERNIHTGDKEYFVKPIDLNSGSKLEAINVIYSKENKKKMEEALDDFKPDIVHINNFQRQLSESIVEAAYKRHIPIVFTAHDLQAICPAISMLDSKNNICELCLKGKYINCIKKKCIKNSNLKSLLGAIEGKYYRMHNVYTKKIAHIITPSAFYKAKLEEDGIDSNKITAIINFVDLENYNLECQDEGYALYVGRLSKEKGILNLIKAFESLREYKLYIAGEGSEKETIMKMIKDNQLNKNIKLLGYLKQDKVKEYIRKASFVVVPSIWYENCPYSVIETLAIGKPIVGANIGGIPELVKNEETGLVYKYDDVQELAEKMKKLFENKNVLIQYGENAKRFANKVCNKEVYYEKLIKIYNDLLRKEEK